VLLPFSSKNSQQPQHQVPLMLIPVVLMPLLSNGAIKTQSGLSGVFAFVQENQQVD